MNGLRRHATLPGVLFAWLLTLSFVLSGLSLARTLPQAHADALAAASLCAPGGEGLPADHHRGDAADCIVCPGPVAAKSFAAPPEPPIQINAPLRWAAAAAFDPSSQSALPDAGARPASARGPPQA